jgi:membrane associated rhomboid family serine protease
MIPISDNNSDRIRTPFVNYILIAINILVFVYYQQFGTNHAFLLSFATIPHEILTGVDVVYEGGLVLHQFLFHLTLLTSMFMHGGIAHLAVHALPMGFWR